MVINTVGSSKKFDAQYTKLVEYEANKMMIDSAKAHGVKKYVMISNLLAGTTEGLISLYRNAIGGGTLHYKLKAENYLR